MKIPARSFFNPSPPVGVVTKGRGWHAPQSIGDRVEIRFGNRREESDTPWMSDYADGIGKIGEFQGMPEFQRNSTQGRAAMEAAEGKLLAAKRKIKSVLGNKHQGVAQVNVPLAEVQNYYRNQAISRGDRVAAETHFDQVCELQREALAVWREQLDGALAQGLPSDSPQVGQLLEDMTLPLRSAVKFYQNNGYIKLAENLISDDIRFLEDRLSSGHPAVAERVRMIGDMYLETLAAPELHPAIKTYLEYQGEEPNLEVFVEKAMREYSRAIKSLKDGGAGEGSIMAGNLALMAGKLLDTLGTDKADVAEGFLIRAANIHEANEDGDPAAKEMMHETHAMLGAVYLYMADAKNRTGDGSGAETMLRKAAAYLERSVPAILEANLKNLPKAFEYQTRLIEAQASLGDLESAAATFENAIQTSSALNGEFSPTTNSLRGQYLGDILGGLANNFLQERKYAQAGPVFKRMIELAVVLEGERSPQVAMLRRAYADEVLAKLPGEEKEAEFQRKLANLIDGTNN